MTTTFSADNAHIRVTVGDPFAIEFPGTPTAGYEWDLAFDNSRLKLISHHYHATSTIGGGTVQRFLLQPVTPGTLTITAHYKRRWETAPIDQRTFTITIEPTP